VLLATKGMAEAAGTADARNGTDTNTLGVFVEIREKLTRTAKICEKVKIASLFCPIGFSLSDSYRTIRSIILLFRQFKSNIYQNIKNLSEVFTSVYCI
jgi:hypothetical protein